MVLERLEIKLADRDRLQNVEFVALKCVVQAWVLAQMWEVRAAALSEIDVLPLTNVVRQNSFQLQVARRHQFQGNRRVFINKLICVFLFAAISLGAKEEEDFGMIRRLVKQ